MFSKTSNQFIRQSNAQANLLNIPRELRDEILALVLTYRHPTPRTPTEVEAQDRLVLDNVTWDGAYPNFYLQDPNAYTPNANGLLLACKQLRSETQDTLKRLDLAHELDIKFVNERYLVPTWTLLPTNPQHFDRVHAVIQGSGVWQHPAQNSKLERRDPWRLGCGGPPGYVWMFYNILAYFLDYGVSVPRVTAPPGIFSVERLELDFVDPENTDLLPLPGQHSTLYSARCARARLPDPQGPELLRPELLARDLIEKMLSMFAMGYHEAEYAWKFHGRIGQMIFMVNGEVIHEIDVGQLLADVEFNQSFGNLRWQHRVEHWIKWKEEAQDLRKKRGLKTVEFKRGWQEQARTAAAEYYSRYPSSW